MSHCSSQIECAVHIGVSTCGSHLTCILLLLLAALLLAAPKLYGEQWHQQPSAALLLLDRLELLQQARQQALETCSKAGAQSAGTAAVTQRRKHLKLNRKNSGQAPRRHKQQCTSCRVH
jgi:hypothetical protein